MPIAIINGTVIGPVVTPPESNAIGRNVSGTKNDKTNTETYNIISKNENFSLRTILKNPITKNTPTPTPTVIKSVHLSMVFDSWSAKICRSGSEIVINTPRIKNTGRIIHSFLLLITALLT